MTTVFSRPQLHSKLVPICILPYLTIYKTSSHVLILLFVFTSRLSILDPVSIEYRFFEPAGKQQRKSTLHCDSQRKALSIASAKDTTACADMSRGGISSCERFKGPINNTNNSTIGSDHGEKTSIPRTIAPTPKHIEKLKPEQKDQFAHISSSRNGTLSMKTNNEHLEFIRHHGHIYSIEPHHFVDVSKESSKSSNYNTMETLSNVETLAIGSTMIDHKYQMENSSQNISSDCNNILRKPHNSEQSKNIHSKNRVSPPSAFIDRIGQV